MGWLGVSKLVTRLVKNCVCGHIVNRSFHFFRSSASSFSLCFVRYSILRLLFPSDLFPSSHHILTLSASHHVSQVAKAAIIVGDPSYFPAKMTRKVGTVVRSICLLDHAIKGTYVRSCPSKNFCEVVKYSTWRLCTVAHILTNFCFLHYMRLFAFRCMLDE